MSEPSSFQVVTRLNVGGPARHVLELNHGLPAYGFRSTLVWGTAGRREGELDPGSERQIHVPSMQRAIAPMQDARAYQHLRRLFAQHRPAVVHTHTAKAGFLGRKAARATGVRVVVHTFHGHVLREYFPRPLESVFRALERRAATRTDALVGVSPQIRDELLDLGIGRPDQWHVMPLRLDLDQLLRSDLDRSDARRRLGLPTDGAIVGVVGRLAPVKDIECFLDAAARISRWCDGVTFVVAGDGELRAELERIGADLLGPRVRFLGWVTDLEALYAALDVVVLTSRNEGTPVALIEAGAAARPVVATRVGGVPEVVRNGRTGTLVPPGHAQGVATQVLQLLENPWLARAFGEAGRRRVEQRFAGGSAASFVADLYRELLDASRA